MEQMKHTPGPWVACADPNAIADDDWMIGLKDGKPDAVAVCSKKDAELIAAAPELLEACKALLEVLGRSYATQTPVPVNCPEAALANEAVSKAIGA